MCLLQTNSPAHHLQPQPIPQPPGTTAQVRIPRRHVVVPTTKASGPLAEEATNHLHLSQQDARMAILEADPYLTDDARAAFVPPPAPLPGLDDVDVEPYPP
eukprot:8927447-Pyramimonas_sp.AAC.1